ncbi:uncharacterized protein LOC128203452 [Mya arenaria]|uniref:uncharacterized protein LOC128203452 n=1 Tax=Mya arenaria TaxID=6604 RepID=UPI0022DEA0C5|nr:uncharacterized protein LOC128203452 [Mya arenaria]
MVWSKHVANYIKVQVVYSHAKTCLEIGQSFSEKKLQYLRKKWNYYAFYGDPAFILGIDNDEKKDGLRCLLQCLRCQKELARHCILTTDDQQPTSLFNEQCFRLLREWISSAPSGHLNLLSKMYDNIVAEFNRIDHGDSTDHERALYITYLEGIKTFDSEKGCSLKHHFKSSDTKKEIDSYGEKRWQRTDIRAVTYDSDGSNKTVIVVPKDAYFDEASNGQNRNDVAKTVTIMDKSLILLDTWFKGLDNVDAERKLMRSLVSFIDEQLKSLWKSLSDEFVNGNLTGQSSQPELFATLNKICSDSCNTIKAIKERFIAKLRKDMALERAFIRQKGQEQLHKLQFMSFFEEDVHHFEADIDEQRKDAMAKIGLEINRSHPSPDCHQEKEK